MTPSGRTQNPSSVIRTDGFCTGRVDSETRSVGAGTVTSTFSGILCRLNGGPVIIFGGQRGCPNDDDDPRWYERLNYCDGRLEARHFENGKLIAKKRIIRISKLADLTQPAVVQESAQNITKISELMGEHTSDQRIRTDGEILACVMVGYKCVAIVALCKMVRCTTNIARLPTCSWRRLRNSSDLYRIQHHQGNPLEGLLQGVRQRRFVGPLGRATLRHRGLDGKTCRKSG